MATPAPPLTLGEQLAHLSRPLKWTAAVIFQIYGPVATTVCAYLLFSQNHPSFFVSVPWRLALLLSWSSYLSLVMAMMSYAQIFLPRTPVDMDRKILYVFFIGVGFFGIGLMVDVVLAFEVEDTRVLAGCTCVVAVFIAGLVAFWFWLARTYGGGGGGAMDLESSASTLPPAADEPES